MYVLVAGYGQHHLKRSFSNYFKESTSEPVLRCRAGVCHPLPAHRELVAAALAALPVSRVHLGQ